MTKIHLDEVLTLSDTEKVFWDSVEYNPFYMYLEGTEELVNTNYVEKNKILMNSLDHQTT